MITVELTHRAMVDLHKISDYSVQTFGKEVAKRYLDDIEAALTMLQEQPGILNSKPEVSRCFQFYPVRNHYLVCSRMAETIIVLTIKYCSMELPARLLELEQSLLQEAKLLYKKLI